MRHLQWYSWKLAKSCETRCPSGDYFEHCILTNKSMGAKWRALSKPSQRRQGPEPCPLWLLVGIPPALGSYLEYRLRGSNPWMLLLQLSVLSRFVIVTCNQAFLWRLYVTFTSTGGRLECLSYDCVKSPFSLYTDFIIIMPNLDRCALDVVHSQFRLRLRSSPDAGRPESSSCRRHWSCGPRVRWPCYRGSWWSGRIDQTADVCEVEILKKIMFWLRMNENSVVYACTVLL